MGDGVARRSGAALAWPIPIADATATMDERTTDGTANRGVSGAADTWPLSAREAAARLGVSERTVRRAIARGELPAARHAGVYRIAPGRPRAVSGAAPRAGSAPRGARPATRRG